MPVHREKEASRTRGHGREASTSRQTGERPIITQVNPRKVGKPEAGKKRESTASKPAPVKKNTEKQAKSTGVRHSSERVRTRTRTLSPTEVKQLNKPKIKPPERKPEPEVPPKPEPEPEPEYEDDFEEYESDFEDESSEEEGEKEEKEEEEEEEEQQQQRRRVSPEPVARGDQKELDEIKQAMKAENEMSKRKSTPEVPAKIVTDAHVLDFSKAKKIQEKARKRGRDLLGMITLDTISYSFFDLPAIPYETYMKMYGRCDTKQVHVQTNEDDLDEETQTEVIEVSNKWVQKPPGLGGTKKYRLTREEKLGVGGDDIPEAEPTMTAVSTTRLNEFLLRASELLLPVLESKSGNNLRMDKPSNQPEEMYFSDGFVALNVEDLPFLKDKSVTNLFSPQNKTNCVYSVHGNSSFGQSIVCMWNVNDLSRPIKILKSENRVTALCSSFQGLVFAGLIDGAVCLWDLKESSAVHESTGQPGWVLRSPTYTTVLLANGHVSQIISVHVLQESNANQSDFSPVQVCSLEEKGTIIIWSVVQGRNLSSEDDLGLAHWGKVKLVKTSAFPCLGKEVPPYVTCNALAVDQTGDVELYVANSLGSVTRMSKYGTVMKPKTYKASERGDATCVEICPFDSNYFLAGCKDGSVRLCARNQELPLISLNGNVAEEGPAPGIVSLSWLGVRPFVFFALDSLARIHIWDLGLSDMYPEVTLALSWKKISCVKLIQSQNLKERPLFALGTADGRIEIHRLKERYSSRPSVEVQKDVAKFLKYNRDSLILSGICETKARTVVDSDDVLVLEPKVVSAMARLQKSSFNGPESEGIDHCEIVDYLSKNYILDGDVESQVITALHSGIKKGFICGLRNGNYSLIGPSSDKMIARCSNTVYHGPKCTCFLINVGKRHCCSFRLGPQSDFVKKESKLTGKKKSFRGQRPPPRHPKKRVNDDEQKGAASPASTSDTVSETCLRKRKVLEGTRSSIDLTSPPCDI